MATTLAVGDVHLKHRLVMPRVERAMELLDVDRVVFLGDACDEWHTSDGLALDALRFFADWVGDARGSGLRIDVLWGNHDYQYRLQQQGPGTHGGIMRETRALLRELAPAVATTADGWLLTHAGLTASWADRYLDEPADADEAARQLRFLCESGLCRDALDLFACGAGRGGWDIPGPLWADRGELEDDAACGLCQIVGHTPVGTCEQVRLGGGAQAWFCDSFSLMPSGVPIGDGSMLAVQDGCPHPIAGDGDARFEPWADVVSGWLPRGW